MSKTADWLATEHFTPKFMMGVCLFSLGTSFASNFIQKVYFKFHSSLFFVNSNCFCMFCMLPKTGMAGTYNCLVLLSFRKNVCADIHFELGTIFKIIYKLWFEIKMFPLRLLCNIVPLFSMFFYNFSNCCLYYFLFSQQEIILHSCRHLIFSAKPSSASNK